MRRLLVPENARPLSEVSGNPAQRRKTDLDSRTLMAADLSGAPLDARSSIPAYIPLDVLSKRMVIARDLPVVPLDTTQAIPSYVPLDVIARRSAIPKDAKPSGFAPHTSSTSPALSNVLEPDVITTGEVNLLAEAAPGLVDETRWVLRGTSMVLHAVGILLLLLIPTLFPTHKQSQAEIDQAARQLGFLYLPPDMKTLQLNKPRPEIPAPALRIDPKIIRQLTPPMPDPLPGTPQPPALIHDQPREAAPPSPNPGGGSQPNTPPAPQTHVEPGVPAPRLEPVKPTQAPANGLVLPNLSAGNSIRQGLDQAARNGGQGRGIGFEGGMPQSPLGGGGSSQGYAGGAIQMLTPDEGVDFSTYLARVLASVKRNWYAIMPESAQMGEQGRVMLTFRIMRDGTVPGQEPNLERTSGKDPLDRAAMSSIRASSPFEHLPPAFSGPYIELRFIFLYNLPLSSANQ